MQKEFAELKESLRIKTDELNGNINKELSQMKIYVNDMVNGKVGEDKGVDGKVEGELGEIKNQIGELRVQYSQVVKVGLNETLTNNNDENITQTKKYNLR